MKRRPVGCFDSGGTDMGADDDIAQRENRIVGIEGFFLQNIKHRRRRSCWLT